jgi:PAS domain S-box-containing protein
MEDNNSSITFEDILSGKYTFKEFHENNHDLGFSSSSWWIKLSIEDSSLPAGEYVLVYDQSWTNTVDAYISSAEGVISYKAGREHGFNSRPVPDRVFVFPVMVKGGNPDIYLRLKTPYRIVLDFKFMDRETYFKRGSIVEPFYGILIAFLMYNLIFFFFIRESVFLYYCGFLFTFLLFLLAFDGTGFMYFWGGSPAWDDFVLTVMLILQSFWVIQFFIKFTGSAELLPTGTRFLRFLAVATIPMALVKLFFPAENTLLWALPLLQLIAVTLIFLSISMAVKGSRSAAYFFLSFILLLGFSLANSLTSYGLISDSYIMHMGMHIGASICAVTFSLGMADRINRLRMRQAESERTVKEQNVKLARNNEELDATNQELYAAMEEIEAANGEMHAIMEELQNSNRLLWDSEQRLSGIFRFAPIGISLFDLNGNITRVNDYALNMLGYTEEEILGKSFQSLTHPDDFSKGRDLFNQLISGRIDTYRYDKRYIRKDGSEWWADVSTSALKSESGKITAMIGVAIDIDEKTKAQMENERIQNQLWQAQKLEAVGTLAGGIAHDFNNILTAILGYTDLAISGVKDGENIEESLLQVKSASVRAKDLVRQILTLSRNGDNVRTPGRIVPIIEDALGLVKVGISPAVKIVFSNNSGESLVLCDQTQVHQVVLNLCTNAHYAMKDTEGEIAVSVSNAAVDSALAALHKVMPGEYVVITVSDTGTGMNRDILERIFDPFFTTKAPGIGTGLGLSVARGIILDHGGFITAESEEGRGTKFSVYLPAYSGTEVPTPAERVDAEIPGGSERLLIVDDEHVIAEMIRLLFQKLGYTIKTSPGGDEALEIFNSAPDEFDLVITDQVMPGMSGLDLTREIKKIRPEMPVILCTGYSEIADPIKAKDLGVSEFLSKPVMTEDLAEAIRRVLDGTKKE